MSSYIHTLPINTSSEPEKVKKKVVRIWTTREEMLLIEGIKRYGINNWEEVASMVPTRTKKQCRERYLNNNESIYHRPWSQEEDNLILQKRKEIGNKWTIIASYLEGRSPNDVKNHFFGRLQKVNCIKEETNLHTTNIIPSELSTLQSIFKPVE
ncbi:transcription factor MYB90, putative, partial [Entamoeba dispar SAW760]